MKLQYFTNVKSIEDVKRQYKKLALKHHPDIAHDDGEKMKQINNEYEFLFERFKNIHENKDGETYTAKTETAETSAEFKDIINSIISFNIDIEIIGSWVWCFNAYECRQQLKDLGFKWANAKKAWVWHSGDDTARKSRMTLSEIRAKYGSETIKEKSQVLKLA